MGGSSCCGLVQEQHAPVSERAHMYLVPKLIRTEGITYLG